MLTNIAVKNAKPRSKPYKMSDGQGLYLLVKPNGGRYWRIDYRFADKRKTLALGVYPTVSLAEARAKRDETKRLIAEGKDPAAQRQIEKLTGGAGSGTTFQEIAEEWLAKLEAEGRSEATMKKTRWLLSFAYPLIGSRRMADITPAELLAVLRTLEASKRYESARRLRGICGQLFRYAIITERARRDISVDLHGALITPKVKHHAAVVDPKSVGELLRAIESFEGRPTIHAALRLAPHVFVRPGELRQAEWNEFDFENAVWTIPAEKTKMRRAHRVPLSRQSLVILESIHPATGRGRFVFPSVRTTQRPLTDNSLNAALRRLGYDKDEMTAHGFRAMATSLLNEMGRWNPDAIERQLGHQESNDVRRAYLRGEYWDERVQMMQAWSDYLDHLREGGKVIVGDFGKDKAQAN